VLIVVVVGLALSISAFALASIWSEEQKRIKLEEYASNYVFAIQQEANSHIEALRNTLSLYAASREVERHEFHKFVSGIISRHVDIQALEWIPRVPHSQRAAVEAQARRDGLPEFQIREQDSAGRLISAKIRHEYFPVYFLEPLSGNEAAMGFDLASQPARRLALEQARDTGEAASTARIRLVQETDSQYGYLIFLPVYRDAAKINTVAQRRHHLLGFVLAVYRINKMIEHIPPALKTLQDNIDLYLYDGSAQREERFLYSSQADHRNIPPITEDQLRTQAHAVKRLQLPGRTWLAYFLPRASLTPTWFAWARWGALAVGLFLTGLLALFLRSTLQHTKELARAHRVLGNTKQKLSLHVQQTPLGVIEWNTRFEVADWNPAAEKIFGYTREEALGRHAVGLIVPESIREQVNELWRVLLENKGGQRSTNESITKDGRAIICEWYNTPLVADNGEVIGITSLVDDVTEHRQAEQALRDSEERNRLLLDSTAEAIYGVDLDGNCTFSNSACLRMLGYDNEQDLLGKNMHQLIQHTRPDGSPYPEQECRIYQAFHEGRGTYVEDEVLWRADGSSFPVEYWSYPIHKKDQVVGSVVTFVDITERKEAQDALMKSEARLERFFEASYEGLFFHDKGKILDVNPAVGDIFGYSPDEVIGMSLFDFVPTEWLPMLQEKMAAGVEGPYEIDIIKRDGSRLPVAVHAKSVELKGRHIRVVTLRDLTEHKQVEEALRRSQKMDAIGQLSGGIAHDFNNQLGVIIGYLDFLQEYVANDEKPRKWVNTATKATLRCMDLTRQLLAFSRRQPKEKVVVDLNALLQDQKNMIARSVTPEVEVQYFLADNLWLTGTNPGEFQDAVLNLVINARDAMPGGGKLLIETSNKHLDADSATAKPGIEAGDYVQLMLNDTGVGMDRKTLGRVFEPFFTTKPEGKGTGLGMAMVYGFVNRYGGHINVYSEPGVGTTFRLYLPRSTTGKSAGIAENTQAVDIPTGNESILVVDDEADLLQLADQYLANLGYQTRLAETAAQALEILAGDGEFDMLFSDVVMPGGMNGYELAQQAIQQKPGLKVLLTSGFTSKSIANNGLARFSAHLLNKPYRKEDLAQRIRLVLDEALDETLDKESAT
jgi:PAS domain S-box-containing protein